LEVRFEALPGRSQDPAPFNSGTIFHTRIYNRLHRMTVPFDERSAGFTWFFSFLVQFTGIREKHKNLLILLDEPGGSLHGKAQQELASFLRG
jgi:predicted ATPase